MAAVRSDPAREPRREPAATGADVGDRRAFGDVQRIHHLIRLLPGFAIRRLEQADVLRREEAGPARGLLRRSLLLRRQMRQRDRDHEEKSTDSFHGWGVVMRSGASSASTYRARACRFQAFRSRNSGRRNESRGGSATTCAAQSP